MNSKNECKTKFCMRIVTVDYYLSSPQPDLDVTRSEFRGSDISQVPVLRIFGTTPSGQKTCLHVHGVFPYLYIPCEDSNPESKQTYLLANSIDKAINISLKQSNSHCQHVYKIVLVKGIPFYGYHSKNHQFYKIFFYNPFFIKRTADLLQSGGIMGMSYQPHEAHLNFVMQFFIDFNLYGMSFINLEHLKFRQNQGHLNSTNLSNDFSYLPDTVKCMSRCELEADCFAIHILNRHEILNGRHGVNPGLEALWEDERIRHENLQMSHEIMPTLSQSRENIPLTDSHNYFVNRLKTILIVNSEVNEKNHNSVNESISESLDFMNSLYKDNMNSSVYPAETPDENDLMNATKVILHHPYSSENIDSENIESLKYSSETIVNEDVIDKCSQDKTKYNIELDNEDMELMVMLENMENNTENDCILNKQSQDFENDEQQDENFTEVLTKPNDTKLTLKSDDISQTQPLSWDESFWDHVKNISQLDGAWDDDENLKYKRRSKTQIPKMQENVCTRSKTKCKIFNLESQFKIFENTPVKNSPKKSPKKSPRNFKPLSKVIEEPSSTSQFFSKSLNTSPICKPLKRKLNFASARAKKKVLPQKQTYVNNLNIPTSKNKKLVKTKSLDDKNFTKHELKHNIPAGDDQKLSINCELKTFTTFREHDSMSIIDDFPNMRNSQTIMKYGTSTKKITSSQYDKQSNYFPQPGTSGAVKKNNNLDTTMDCSLSNSDESISNNCDIISFYNKTNYETSLFMNLSNNRKVDLSLKNESNIESNNLVFQENSLKDSISDEEIDKNKKILISKSSKLRNSIKSHNSKKLIVTPAFAPPSYFDVLSTLEDYNIPKQRYPIPFYSNYKDIGGQIEIGQIILKLKGQNVTDLKEFESNLANNESLMVQRQKVFLQSDITQNNDLNNLECILSTARSCVMTPVIKPPAKDDVMKWFHALKHEKDNQIYDNSVHEKIHVFMPSSPDQEIENSQFDVLSISTCSQNSSELNKFEKNDCTSYIKLSQSSKESDIACGQKIENSSPVLNFTSELNAADKKDGKLAEYINNYLSTSNAFKFSGENYQEAEVHHENDNLTLLTLEVLTSTRGDFNPDPHHDSVCAVFYSVSNDCHDHHRLPKSETGFIAIENNSSNEKQINILKCTDGLSSKYNIIAVKNEENVFEEVINLIYKWDPDILCGYEIEMLSWGYLIQRAFVLNINLPEKLSRITEENKVSYKTGGSQEMKNEMKLIGRITLDVWRLLRHEIALTNYSFENITYHVLHERHPLFSFKTLSFWWYHPSELLKILCIEYFLTRVSGTIRILQQLDLIGRTSELAKLFGIQWFEVLSRGSQFRVESMMFRLSRSYNYILVSPSIQQRAAMKAPECLALILEPESRFYSDPVIVLDFQSLYPSMMIAYNYCFSTCIGKVDNMGRNAPYEFGAARLRISPKILKDLSDKNLINWSPCGVGFVKPVVRKGILPNMLQSILSTRFMVKKAMKKYKSDKTLIKILHNRQLGLKLIANVTYGYTAANFSGRMPCVEVGDSVVAKGRETLERAIKTVENTQKWNAKVIYGDTDSIFVLLPGRSRFDAFGIGAEIAETVTNENPTPVKLKLEKIYQPCILQTKKRYVGYKYESADQKLPEYEAKGIETVRRDGCPASAKILEKSLKILFETYDVSKVKLYLFKKFQNILEDRCNIQDFVFAREFRGINAYKPGASIPALEIAKRLKLIDPRKEPRSGERVPYVIINGAPGETLLNCARRPQDLLNDPSLRINHTYYITRVIIPPLNRCFTLIGADINLWLVEMPRKLVQLYPLLNISGKLQENKKNTISQYFTKVNCVGCDEQTTEGLCINCISIPQITLFKLYNKINMWQRKHLTIQKMCQSCCGRGTHIDCISIDCPVVFNRNMAKIETQQIPYLLQLKKNLLDF